MTCATTFITLPLSVHVGVTALDFRSAFAEAGGSLVHVNFGTGLASDLAGGASGAHSDGSASLASDAMTAAWDLRGWPLEANNWHTVNSRRADVLLSRTGGRFDELQSQSNAPLPANERSQERWNSNPWQLDSSGSPESTEPGGTGEPDPGTFLLPYWMARYHGLIAPPTSSSSSSSMFSSS